MTRKPTQEEFDAIMGIVQRVEADRVAGSIKWGSPDDLSKAILLHIIFYDEKPALKKGCSDCHFALLDRIRNVVNLPQLTREVSESKSTHRMETCKACPAYHETAQSCGHLFLDAIAPKPVMIEGEQVQPCGCYLPLKVKMKHAQCPARKW